MVWIDRPVTLVYDGECTFCIRSLKRLKAFDAQHRLVLVDGTQADALVRYPQLAQADLSTAMYALADGALYRGFDAFRRAFWALPLPRILAPLMYIPGVAPIGRIVYAAIARNRQAFGCASGACEIPKQ